MNNEDTELIVTDKIEEKDRNEIFEGLLRYNLARLEDKHPRDLGIYIEDGSGKKIAGLIGHTHGNWLTVSYLWVVEAQRKNGIGSRLLMQAEDIARERGCRFVFLDTFSFQAPDFYRKHGYEEVFALEQYPLTGERYYYTKKL